MKSLDGKTKLDNIRVLDACTIINLLRIDNDNYLSNILISDLSLNIAQIVYDEIRKNIKKNPLDDESQKRIDMLLPSFIMKINKDIEIPKDLNTEYYDELIQFSKHKKKKNGELVSSALSLILCRENNSKVLFYTDDFPAKEQFAQYFEYQQIGYIGDSVDLLLWWFCSQPNFTLIYLKEYLTRLRGEYNTDLVNFCKAFENLSNSLTTKERKDKNLFNNIQNIVNGYYHNHDNMLKGIYYFSENKKYDQVNCIIDKYDVTQLISTPLITKKINNVLEYLDKYHIFKI